MSEKGDIQRGERQNKLGKHLAAQVMLLSGPLISGSADFRHKSRHLSTVRR